MNSIHFLFASAPLNSSANSDERAREKRAHSERAKDMSEEQGERFEKLSAALDDDVRWRNFLVICTRILCLVLILVADYSLDGLYIRYKSLLIIIKIFTY